MIEQASNDDIAAIVALWTKVSLADFARHIGNDNIHSFIESGELASESERLLSSTYVLKDDKGLAGFVVILGDLIELLIVRPESQNKLVGKQLYKFAIGKIREEHCRVRAECFEKNERANSMLQRLGYKSDGSYIDDMGFVTNRYSKEV